VGTLRRRVTRHRIAFSRSISRVLIGREIMLCAVADERQHWSRHLLNALFLDHGHCAAAADWEAADQRRRLETEVSYFEGWLVDVFRRKGVF
jgi:hypothetical protein